MYADYNLTNLEMQKAIVEYVGKRVDGVSWKTHHVWWKGADNTSECQPIVKRRVVDLSDDHPELQEN